LNKKCTKKKTKKEKMGGGGSRGQKAHPTPKNDEDGSFTVWWSGRT